MKTEGRKNVFGKSQDAQNFNEDEVKQKDAKSLQTQYKEK